MNFTQRLTCLLLGSGLLASLLAAALPAAAQSGNRDYPSRPIRIIVAYSAGTASDTMARAMTEELGKQMGVPVVIENREGAGGNIGHTAAAKAAPDGYTVLMGTTWLALTSHSTTPPAYDAVRDFIPLVRIGQAPMIVVAGSASPYKSWASLVTRGKTAGLTYGTSGRGGASHVFTEVLNKDFGMRGIDIPYKNTNQAMLDVATAKVDFHLANLPPTRGLIQAGQLLPLAVGAKQRIAALPDTPTLAELTGNPNYELVVWYGFFAPAGTPPEVVARLQRELAKASDTPAMRARFEEAGGQLSMANGADLGRQVQADNARFARIVQEMGLGQR